MIAFIILLILSVPVTLLRGVVLVDLLNWSIGYHITVVHAVLLSYVGALFTGHLKTSVDTKDGDPWWKSSVTALVQAVILTLVLWGFGYIWHLFA